MTSWTGRNEKLAGRLGELLTPDWRGSLNAAPRHLFLPDTAWRVADGSGERVAIDRHSDPSAWFDAAYSNDIIVTTPEDAEPSSCSMPYMVFTMLSRLDLRPGHKVLEIGTGTGWTVALLTAYLGGAKGVHSVEVDPAAAEQAQANLAKLGIGDAHLLCADGSNGHPGMAPFDRVIATCAVHRVPYPWVEQCQPGGVILTPWNAPLGHGALLRLTVNDDGTASGPFVHPAAFMWLRSQRPSAPDEPDDFIDRADRSAATLSLSELLAPQSMFAIGLLVPGVKEAYDYDVDGYLKTFWMLSTDSWASASPDGTVRQLGERRLWDEAEAAFTWWTDRGSPEMTRFGITVTPQRQHAWLDDPSRPIGHG
jgi:protein-L-isoaspartate(D-aspartate) O-methyltransferase